MAFNSEWTGESLTREPILVSVIISNFNYGHFLADAIDSCLAQDHKGLEIIVVDDGSTDRSRDVIASYGDRVVPLYKDNGGQGSAFNAGFRASHGELICLLDSDDVLLPNKVSKVVEAYRDNPGTSLVYHRLTPVDVNKQVLAGPWPETVLRGNIRYQVERAGGWWPHPTTSALCPSRTLLNEIMPMPAETNRLAADAYVVGLAPFFGSVTGIDDSLALYRRHYDSASHFHGASFREQCRLRLQRLIQEFDQVDNVLRRFQGRPASMSLEDNLRYQQWRLGAGDSGSAYKVIRAAFRTPTLPISIKLREVARMALSTISY